MVTPQTANYLTSPPLIQPRKLMTEFNTATAKSPPESLVGNFTAIANPYGRDAKKLKQGTGLGEENVDSTASWEEEAMNAAAEAEAAMLLLSASKATAKAKSAGLKTEGITANDVQDAYNGKKISTTEYDDVMLEVAIEASKVDQKTDETIEV